MADNRQQPGGQDRTRINVHESYELRDWSQSLGVTPDELREAVAAVGPEAKNVREYLNNHRR